MEHVSFPYGARLYIEQSIALHPAVGADPIATLLRRDWGRSSARTTDKKGHYGGQTRESAPTCQSISFLNKISGNFW